MKKLLSVLALVCVVCMLAACGTDGGADASQPTIRMSGSETESNASGSTANETAGESETTEKKAEGSHANDTAAETKTEAAGSQANE